MSNEPCNQGPSGTSEQASTNNNPRQSRISNVREQIADYDIRGVYNADPPPRNTDPQYDEDGNLINPIPEEEQLNPDGGPINEDDIGNPNDINLDATRGAILGTGGDAGTDATSARAGGANIGIGDPDAAGSGVGGFGTFGRDSGARTKSSRRGSPVQTDQKGPVGSDGMGPVSSMGYNTGGEKQFVFPSNGSHPLESFVYVDNHVSFGRKIDQDGGGAESYLLPILSKGLDLTVAALPGNDSAPANDYIEDEAGRQTRILKKITSKSSVEIPKGSPSVMGETGMEYESYTDEVSRYSYNFRHNPVFRAAIEKENYPVNSPGQLNNNIDTFRFVSGLFYSSLKAGEAGKTFDKIKFANQTGRTIQETEYGRSVRTIKEFAFSGYQEMNSLDSNLSFRTKPGASLMRISDGLSRLEIKELVGEQKYHHNMAQDYYRYQNPDDVGYFSGEINRDYASAFQANSEVEIRQRLASIADSVSTYGNLFSSERNEPHAWVDRAKTQDFVAALAKFPNGKLEEIEFKANTEKRDTELNTLGDDYQFYNCYTGYMRSGWSWRNYFHGFYPLVSPKNHEFIKILREKLGSREQVLVGTGPVDYNFVHPSERVSYNLLGPSNAFGGPDALPNWFIADQFGSGEYNDENLTAGDRSRTGPTSNYQGGTDSNGTPYPLVTYDNSVEAYGLNTPRLLPTYSTNLFPVIPFFGVKTLIPDEIDNAADLVNDYWGGPEFLATLIRLYAGSTRRGSTGEGSEIGVNNPQWDASALNTVRDLLSTRGFDPRMKSKYHDYKDANTIAGRSSYLPRSSTSISSTQFTEDDYFAPNAGAARKLVPDIIPITSKYARFATFQNKTFKDYVTAIPGFVTEYDLQTARSRLSSYIYVKGEYNFFDPNYENYISKDNVDYFAFSGYPETDADTDKRKLVLDNLPILLPDPYSYNPLDPSNPAVVSGDSSLTPEELLRTPFTRYNFLPDISNFNSKQIFDIDRIKSKQFKDVYLKRKTFPMHTEIEILQSGKSILNEFILSSGQSSTTLTSFANASKTERATVVSNLLRKSEDEQDIDVSFEGNIRYANLEDWANSITFGDNTANSPLSSMADLIGFAVFKSKLANYCQGKARSYAQIASGELAHSEVIGFKVDKYELTNPTEAPENQFGARSSFTNRRLIKSYYFAGDNTDDPTSFIDTQVEYGRAYEYEIYSICLIVGTEYAYLDTTKSKHHMVAFANKGRPANSDSIYGTAGEQSGTFRDDNYDRLVKPNLNYDKYYGRVENETIIGQNDVRNPVMRFSVISKPCPVISEVFARRITVGILDKPPIPPDVNVVPFKNVPNRIRFNLNSVTGELFAKPVILDDDDYDQYWLSSMNQGLNPVDVLGENSQYWGEPPAETQLLHFKNDDQCLKFEVFRITGDRPTSWASFVGNKLPVVSEGATSTSFTDTIATNVKYYYAFRSVDVHGHVSLPGHIHEVELRREEGRSNSYLLHNIYKYSDIDKESRNRKSTFKRYLKIKPSLIQTEFPNLLENDFRYSAWADSGKHLGTSANPIWGKTILYRVKSKATGKMVEIRVKFVRKDATVDNRGEAEFDE